MIILDTNVVSAVMLRERDAALDSWLDRADPDDLWITTIVLFEIKAGIDAKDEGRRKRSLEIAFSRLVDVAFKDRILSFDLEAALAAAAIAAERKKRGRPTGAMDTMIAGIGVSRKASIATRNVKHFADLPVTVINPWRAGR